MEDELIQINRDRLEELDRLALVVGSVEPLPGDGIGLNRRETDESLRRRLSHGVVNHDPGDEEPLLNWL